MTNLDDKLKELVFKMAGGIKDGGEDEITQIKQAFADEGYVAKSELKSWSYTAELLTGTEWYDRFEKELNNLGVNYKTGMTGLMASEILEAAKRAAGLDNA